LLAIEQAIYGTVDAEGYRFLGRSKNFLDEWLPAAEQLCTRFGERPAGVACPECIFARPLGPRHIAVVQVADQGVDDQGRPGSLGFRILALPRRLYEDLGGDPFRVAEEFPADWTARGDLPALQWSGMPPAPRTVAKLQTIMNVPNCPTLLGGAQTLLDGGHLVFERREPDPKLLRSLWELLPTQSRSELWPATFAFGNANHFDVVVVPRAAGPGYDHYVNEVQAGDYPEGRYELQLQCAVEAGDQREMDALFARRSRAQTLRLGLSLLAVFILVPMAVVLLVPDRPAELDGPSAKKNKTAQDQSKVSSLKLGEFPQFTDAEQAQLNRQVHALGKRLNLVIPDSPKAVVALDEGLDKLQPDHKPRRDPGPLDKYGPPSQQFRALLWKHGVGDFNQPGLHPTELVELLEKRLVQQGILKDQ
jgi:hypothetical protein